MSTDTSIESIKQDENKKVVAKVQSTVSNQLKVDDDNSIQELDQIEKS